MGKRAFWPGFSWRILAHERTGEGAASRHPHTGKVLDLRYGKRWLPPADADTKQREYREGFWEFDELCIDDWFHLEQMDDRDWWLGIGNGDDYWHINVHIDSAGNARVRVEKQSPLP